MGVVVHAVAYDELILHEKACVVRKVAHLGTFWRLFVEGNTSLE